MDVDNQIIEMSIISNNLTIVISSRYGTLILLTIISGQEETISRRYEMKKSKLSGGNDSNASLLITSLKSDVIF